MTTRTLCQDYGMMRYERVRVKTANVAPAATFSLERIQQLDSAIREINQVPGGQAGAM
jgi:hypothetical protein